MINGYVADVLVYQHDLFREDDIELCRQITRSPSRRNSLKQVILQATNQDALAPATPPAKTFENTMPRRVSCDDEGIQAAASATNQAPPTPPTTRAFPRRASSDESLQAAISAPDDELLLLADELAEVDALVNDYEMSDWGSESEA